MCFCSLKGEQPDDMSSPEPVHLVSSDPNLKTTTTSAPPPQKKKASKVAPEIQATTPYTDKNDPTGEGAIAREKRDKMWNEAALKGQHDGERKRSQIENGDISDYASKSNYAWQPDPKTGFMGKDPVNNPTGISYGLMGAGGMSGNFGLS